VIETVEDLYSTMLAIEKKHGMEKSLAYLEGFLEEHETTYKDFIAELIRPRGVLSVLLDAFKKMFS
ncbi:MAG: histidine kinase, partial [Campylobacterales bacterium]|nr:histidine kinase [Campylobacterales bacterium]